LAISLRHSNWLFLCAIQACCSSIPIHLIFPLCCLQFAVPLRHSSWLFLSAIQLAVHLSYFFPLCCLQLAVPLRHSIWLLLCDIQACCPLFHLVFPQCYFMWLLFLFTLIATAL
jgi:hypothetical protein